MDAPRHIDVAGEPPDDERRAIQQAVLAASELQADERTRSAWWREGMADAVRETRRRPGP